MVGPLGLFQPFADAIKMMTKETVIPAGASKALFIFAPMLTFMLAVLGLAVVHSITRGIGSRPFLLGGIYASIFVFGWPVLVLCLLGIAEAALDLRARAARKRGASPRT